MSSKAIYFKGGGGYGKERGAESADKRYREKTQDQYEHFVVNLKREECASICAAIKAAGMGKAEFLRWAVGELENKNK